MAAPFIAFELRAYLGNVNRTPSIARRGVELRFFGGLDIDDTAEVLKVSPETVKRERKLAKAWLRRVLRQQGEP
jgi:DNA-directed RNA polymerase specialized sigma24 family protein